MTFWTIFGSAMLLMILLYLLIGPLKFKISAIVYGICAVTAAIIIFMLKQSLYEFDLFALLIPYLIVLPIHLGVKHLIKNYVVKDNHKHSRRISTVYNRIANVLWIIEGALLLGLILALINAINDEFNGLNITTISIVGGFILVILLIVIFLGSRKKFNYVLVVGKHKRIYKYKSNKAKLIVSRVVGSPYKVLPRGIYTENGEISYLYFLKEDIDIDQTYFKPHESELFTYLSPYIEDTDALEIAYNHYIEEKSH